MYPVPIQMADNPSQADNPSIEWKRQMATNNYDSWWFVWSYQRANVSVCSRTISWYYRKRKLSWPRDHFMQRLNSHLVLRWRRRFHSNKIAKSAFQRGGDNFCSSPHNPVPSLPYYENSCRKKRLALKKRVQVMLVFVAVLTMEIPGNMRIIMLFGTHFCLLQELINNS